MSAYDRNALPHEPRLTDWRAPSPLYVPGSSRSGLPAPPASPYAGEKKVMDPPSSRHKLRRTAPPPSPYAGEKKTEDSPPATQSQPEAPQEESEDEVLIRLREKYTLENKGIDWAKVSQEMKAQHFDRSANWCYMRWIDTLDRTKRKSWKP